ncbi:MAG: hypothetical protein COB04_18305 [Gammaproteobacteria bacterium]|nr:MAG: hypothetical protein COB04_18305 [Gammaproteobacteria bacterium]
MGALLKDLFGIFSFSFVPIIFCLFSLTLLTDGESFLNLAAFFLVVVLLIELPINSYQDWDYGHDRLFQGQLVFSIFAFTGYLLVFLWYWMAPSNDFLGLGALSLNSFGLDVIASRESSGLIQTAAAVFLAVAASLFLSVIVGHELIHKRHGSILYRVGVFAHIITFFSYFSISHPTGHHYTVATKKDHASPRRGESVYHFMWRSRSGKQKHTIEQEKKRLTNIQLPFWHWKNEALRNWFFEAILALSLIIYGGWQGLFAIVIIGLSSNVFIEVINYLQHYGLLREMGKPIEARHIWSSNRALLNRLYFGAGRHAIHHTGVEDYWRYSGGSDKDPQILTGLMTTAYISFIPFLFKRLMNRKLMDWDWNLASTEEQRLAVEACKVSGDKDLIAHGKKLESHLQRTSPNSKTA